jgi:Mg2+/Co2+ transporter CorC
MDEVNGFVLRSDVLLALIRDKGGKGTLADVMLPVAVVLEQLELDRLFKRFIEERQHLMMVLDERGSVAGVVTLEDVVETIFGIEIMDETDEVADLQGYARKLWQVRAKRMGLKIGETGWKRGWGSRYMSRNCMKIGYGSDLGIKGLRNLGIEGILSILFD